MAIDGINILESDLSIDVQNEILDRYDLGQSADEIKSYLKNELQNLSSSLDFEIYISTACLTLWKIGLLDDYFIKQLEIIVENGADKTWAEIDKTAISQRNIALQKLLKKVSTPIFKVRKPQKHKTIVNSLFTKGEVIAFQIDNKYRCLIFEEFYQYRIDAYYAFVPTTYNDCLKPTIDTILTEEVPVTKNNAMGSFGVRKLSLYYTDIEKLKGHFISIGHLNIDLENFFPSISRNRIAGLFRSKPFNFSKDIAKDLANICTYNNHLPQGAPTSPILSNMICRKMDNELQNLAKAFRCTYTRYADDITFSTMKKIFPPEIAFNDIEQDKIITKLGWILTNIILQNGFSVNVNKTRLQNYTTRQEVTGLVVNKKINIQRKYIKKIRAVLHDWEMNGIDNAVKKYNMHDKDKLSILNPERKARKFKQVIRGKIEFIGNVRGKNDFIYAKFFNQYNRLIKKSAKHIPENEIEQINEYLWMLYSEETFIQGTAFSIEDGRVITCAHCISNDTLAYKVNDPDQKYKIKILKKFDVNTGIDIAVLNILDEDNRIIRERGFKLGDVDNLKQFGVNGFIEIGNGVVLSKMTSRALPDIESLSINSIESLKN